MNYSLTKTFLPNHNNPVTQKYGNHSKVLCQIRVTWFQLSTLPPGLLSSAQGTFC